ncbi:hypothetical protein AU467_33105 [Mesorhizobium loti]|uniref:Uncharacterized protein n=1 Tax=Rhizobium loti TaxID=381 RepID=A0A101KMN7_RHILI|nr:hypothetical protein AU467_33105 [Mesorhizobium loti]
MMRAVRPRSGRAQAAAQHVRPRARAGRVIFRILAQREVDRSAAAAEQAIEEAHRRHMRLAAGRTGGGGAGSL